MTLLGQVVGSCEGCGKPVLNTQSRVSAHGPLNYRTINGAEFDALLKTCGYVPDGRYGHGGVWEAPRLVHVACASAELVEAYRRVGVLD